MFRHAIPIGRIFGISIDLDYSWFLVFGLLTWILAVSYYPAEFKNWSAGEYWFMGAFTAIMLFVSVLLHELGHSIVAKRYGIAVPRITLFVFGGVSQIATEPASAGQEFWIAAAGPAVSFLLALFFWGLRPVLVNSGPLLALAKYLALLNFVLAIFNLVPGFPLDGGRVFRSIMWGITKDFRRATAIATVTGRFFGYAFIFYGVWQAIGGNVFNGLWIAFIGWYLESAASSQGQTQLVKDLLGSHKVSEVMNQDFARISGDVTLQELVDKNVLAQGRRSFVVGDGKATAGLITLSTIQQVPRSAWPTTTADRVMIPLDKVVSIQPTAELWTALEKMGRDGVNQLPVINGDSGHGVVGMLSRDDLVHYLGALQTLGK
jgi:Zn-dependent protease/predicted transcriptional regulator